MDKPVMPPSMNPLGTKKPSMPNVADEIPRRMKTRFLNTDFIRALFQCSGSCLLRAQWALCFRKTLDWTCSEGKQEMSGKY
jgi:hypothetical protein